MSMRALKSIKQLRAHSADSAKFQARTYEPVLALSRLLSRSGREHGMPAYAEQAAVPPGFPERFVDFVYAEDLTRQYSLEGVDLTLEPCSALADDGKGRDTFAAVMSAVRDVLLSSVTSSLGLLSSEENPYTISPKQTIPRDLCREFQRARLAYLLQFCGRIRIAYVDTLTY